MRLIDATRLENEIRKSGKTMDWHDLNLLMGLVINAPTIDDVIKKPKKGVRGAVLEKINELHCDEVDTTFRDGYNMALSEVKEVIDSITLRDMI